MKRSSTNSSPLPNPNAAERRYRVPDLSILRHETLSWLTLITCRSYSESTDSYRWRVAVRSVLMEVR